MVVERVKEEHGGVKEGERLNIGDENQQMAQWYVFFFSSRRRHTRFDCDWSSDVCSSDLILEGFEQNPRGQSGLADAGWANEDEVLLIGDELQFSESADLFAIDSGLASERERVQRPAFRQLGVADAPFQSVFLSRMPLSAHETRDELGVGRVLFFGGAQLFVIDIQNAPELEILQELFEFFIDLHQAFL